MTPTCITLRSYRIVYVRSGSSPWLYSETEREFILHMSQTLVEWEHRLTSSAHLSALGGHRNMRGVGSLVFHIIFLYFFHFLFLVRSRLLMP